MHQRMQSGSIARAASALPMSAVSQPNWSRMPVTVFFAASSLPQMNIVGLPPGKSRIHHERVADRVERLHEARARKLALQALHERVVEAREEFEDAVRPAARRRSDSSRR